MKNDIEKLRKKINLLDKNLLTIIHGRLLVARRIGLVKKIKKIRIKDVKRERELRFLHQKWAKELGFPPSFAKRLFKIIITESRKIQSSL